MTSHPSHPPRSAPEQQFKPFVKKRNRHKPCSSISIERDLSLLKLQYYHDFHELQSTAAIVGYSYKYAYTHKPMKSCTSTLHSLDGFYRAMLCIRGTSHGPVSVCVCLSQAGVLLKRQNVGSHKQHHTIPPGSLVFCCQRSPRNSTGVTPYEAAECRWGGSKSATFDK